MRSCEDGERHEVGKLRSCDKDWIPGQARNDSIKKTRRWEKEMVFLMPDA